MSVLRYSVFALLVTAGAAGATPVTLHYDGPSAADPKNVTITAAPVAYAGGGSWPKTVGAWGFRMRDTSGPLGRFVAWCLDLEHFLGNSGGHAYTITSTPFSNSYGLDATQKGRIGAVFDANYATLDIGDGKQAAAFQLALWNALYDSDWTVAGGTFSATAGNGIATLANTFLGLANGYAGPRAWNQVWLESTGTPARQNLVTVSPVPLPAAGLVLFGALAMVAGAARRRRR